MIDKLTQLINTLYEAEGLVEMALRRKADSSDRVLGLVLNKCHEIGRVAAELQSCIPQGEDSEIHAANTPFYGSVADSTDAGCNRENADGELPEDDKEVEIFTSEILPSVKPEIYDEHDASIFESDEVTEVVADTDVTDTDRISSSDVPHNTQSVSPRSSVMQAFSINDKFRFKRELFASSDEMMIRTLSEIQSMISAEAVRIYCFNTFDWNPKDTVVKDFFTIIDRYLKKNER